jgi:molecular chaperone DnaJ
VLSDQDQRERYNRYGSVDGASPFGGPDITSATEFFDAIFGDLFGLGRKKSAVGRDLRYTLELDFEEAALGCEKVVVFDRPEDCEACFGTGADGGTAGLVTCSRCNGEGVIRK